MKSRNAFRSLVAAVLVASLVLAGCAAGGGVRKSESVADRAVARWNHLINKEVGSAWELMTPGARAVKSRNAYIAETLVKPVTWTSVEFVEQDCPSENQCTLKLNVGFKVRSRQTGVGLVEASSPVTETWLRSDGEWFYLPPSSGR